MWSTFPSAGPDYLTGLSINVSDGSVMDIGNGPR